MARTTALLLAALAGSRFARAQEPGTFKIVGETKVSAMMMFLGGDDNVYILDKSENNAAQINNHPAMGAVWNLASNTVETIDIVSNAFCAAGSQMPDGSWATFGGNQAIQPSADQQTGIEDYTGQGAAPTYGSVDGRRSVRLLKPCSGPVTGWGPECQWNDDPATNAMARRRWYATAETLGDGSVALIGGMVNGGYINRDVRWFTNPATRDPVTQQHQAENTVEFFPARPHAQPQQSQFLVNAGGLNTYAHAALLKSGKLFLQANISTILYDTNTFEETPLPDMPNGVVRVYPASGGVAVLPLTPENNWNPTLLFCGGTNAFNDEEWGTYLMPNNNPWERRASSDCQRITPEPEDGTAAAYVQDDEMPDPRTMGQFIQLPDGKLLMINGAKNGTAGYSTATPAIRNLADMPYYMSLAAEEVLTPALYDPAAPAGQRWITEALGASTIPRLYHSSATLLPDGSVFIAGSNPGADVTAASDTVRYPTEYRAEVYYPPYFGKQRPETNDIPKTALTYGGPYFNMTIAASSLSGNPNELAAKTKVALIRTGFSTHGMNMGQRYVQLHNSYTVNVDGSITLHVSPPPPNANILTPGSAVMFIVVDGVPSIGKTVMVGSGQVGEQELNAPVALPPVSLSTKFSQANNSNGNGKPGSIVTAAKAKGLTIGAIIGIVIALLALLGFCMILAIMIARRRRKMLARWREIPSGQAAQGQGMRQPLGRSLTTANGSPPTSAMISRPIPQPQMGANPFADAAAAPMMVAGPSPARSSHSRHANDGNPGIQRSYSPQPSIGSGVGIAVGGGSPPQGTVPLHTRTLSNGSHNYAPHPYGQPQEQYQQPFAAYHQPPQANGYQYYDSGPARY
jgi:hypothetical protein